ncbi:MAG: tRNA (adenosine(37)-N6)-threonylcarbamoyltransferase complex ATPase subunit type 1 TsaE [Acidimicrobiales bacterium]
MTPLVLRARTSGAEETRRLAAEVAGVVRPGDIVLLAGDLGTGKTVWVQGFARGLGVTEQVTSPTFTLVRPYGGKHLQLLHADVYRLDNLSEVVDLGLVEQLDGPVVACIEWGDLAAPALPADFIEVRIDLGGDDDDRTLSFRPVGSSWAARMDDLREALSQWASAE